MDVAVREGRRYGGRRRRCEPEEFTTQGDAESWIGEVWKELLEGGADQVTLFEDATKIYGPMSLQADEAPATARAPGPGRDFVSPSLTRPALRSRRG